MSRVSEAPAWVAALTDDDLRDRFGDATFERGLAYARQGAVRDLQSSGEGAVLMGQVQGNDRAPYQTVVSR